MKKSIYQRNKSLNIFILKYKTMLSLKLPNIFKNHTNSSRKIEELLTFLYIVKREVTAV